MNEIQKTYLKKLITALDKALTNNNKQEEIEVLVLAILDIAIFKKDIDKVMVTLDLLGKL